MNNSINTTNIVELMQKVISTNEVNTEIGVDLKFAHEDISNTLGEIESTLRGAEVALYNMKSFSKDEGLQREKFLQSFPTSVPLELTDDAKKEIQKFELNSKIGKNFLLGGAALLLIVFAILLISYENSKKWYAESIRAKSELRQEILCDFEKEGLKLYKISDYEVLLNNRILLERWITSSKKSAEVQKFLKFKEGYTAGRGK